MSFPDWNCFPSHVLLEQGPSASFHSFPACDGILFCNAIQYEEQYTHIIDDPHYVSFFSRIMSRKPFIFLSNFSFQLSLWFSACSCEQVHNQKVQSYICGASSKALRTLFLVNKWDNIDASCHLHQDIWHFKFLIVMVLQTTAGWRKAPALTQRVCTRGLASPS